MPIVIGFDTETVDGPPTTVQFYSDQLPAITGMIWELTKSNAMDKTLRYLARHCLAGEYVIYGHNLRFDLLSLFYPVRHLLARKNGDFEFTHRDWKIAGVYGTPTFCRLNRKDVQITIVDSFSWLSTNLIGVANLVCPDLPKLEHPENIGSVVPTTGDAAFQAYAMRDAEIAYHAGMAIDAMHVEFDLRQTVSVANMAATIFAQHYIKDSAPIWNTGPDFAEGLMFSYHGGKNTVAHEGRPGWHSHVDAWDLSSAYPHAMTLLPAFSQSKLFRHKMIFSNRAREFPEHGVYCVTGTAEKCAWPCVFDKDFKAIRGGPFEKEWMTGYELNEARRIGEIKISRVFGHVYDTEKDPVTNTAFARYVNDFYALKQSAPNKVIRTMYKVLLNALYGKFVQTREVEADDGTVTWKHGQLHHPFAATLIPGHTRAVMHRLEHETSAIHTATDGVFCGHRNSPVDRTFPWAPQEGIGSIESEGVDLELLMLRNKLYILYSNDPNEGIGIKSNEYDNYYITKFAKHGFQGTIQDLEHLAETDKRVYEIEKPNTLKMALKQGKVPNKFERQERRLNIEPLTVHYNHK